LGGKPETEVGFERHGDRERERQKEREKQMKGKDKCAWMPSK